MYRSGVATNIRTQRGVKPAGLLLTVQRAADELGISKSKMFTLLSSGDIASLLIGPKIRRVPRAALEEYIAKKLAEAADLAETQKAS